MILVLEDRRACININRVHKSGHLYSDNRLLAAQTFALALIASATQVAVYGTVAALALCPRSFIRSYKRSVARTTDVLLMTAALLTATQAWAANQQLNDPIASSVVAPEVWTVK